MKKVVLNFPFFSLGFFPVVFAAVTLFMVACGTGGGMGDGKETSSLKGDTPGTGSLATTGFEDANQEYNPSPTRNQSQAPAGQTIKVDSTEARGNSRWTEEGDAGATQQPSQLSSSPNVAASGSSRLDKTAGKRARYSLIGSKESNRSRVGQSLRADNPERPTEDVLTVNK